MRSPPPPRQVPVVLMPPPVPAIPRQYAGMTSLPLRRNLPPFPAVPPILPISEPLTFEDNDDPLNLLNSLDDDPLNSFAQAPRVPRRQSRNSAPGAAPRSHHTPSMGLGGALISSNNARAHREAAHAARSATTVRRPAVRGVRRDFSRRVAITNDLDGILRGENDEEPHIRRVGYGAFIAGYIGLGDGPTSSSSKPPDYHQSYTHPSQPEPGFTFDFASNSEDDKPRTRHFPPTSANAPIIIDDDDSPIKSRGGRSSASASSGMGMPKNSSLTDAGKLTAVLVCARCLDPLLLNETLQAEEAQRRRVWALRCGHMIDEKCLNEIGEPAEEVEASLTDPKGKGKAKANPKITYSEALSEAAVAVPATIRSRLRSSNSSSSVVAEPDSLPPSVQPPPSKRRRVSSKSSKSKVDAEYEWTCPVPNCGVVHASVMVNGIWGPEKERNDQGVIASGMKFLGVKAGSNPPRGAIPVFA